MKQAILSSIIIPCFNEEKRILLKFDSVYQYVKGAIPSFEFILVNDGSTDKTEDTLKKICKRYPFTKIISYQKNQGKGYAIQQGVKLASGQIICFMDADFAVMINEVPNFIKKINEGADIIIADRHSNKSRALGSRNYIRRFLGKSLAYINNFILNTKFIYDTQCGFKFFKNSVAKELFKDLKIKGWLFDMEILLGARSKNYKISAIPVVWEETQNSKVKIINDFIPVAKDLLLIYFIYAPLKLLAFLIFMLILIIFFTRNHP